MWTTLGSKMHQVCHRRVGRFDRGKLLNSSPKSECWIRYWDIIYIYTQYIYIYNLMTLVLKQQRSRDVTRAPPEGPPVPPGTEGPVPHRWSDPLQSWDPTTCHSCPPKPTPIGWEDTKKSPSIAENGFFQPISTMGLYQQMTRYHCITFFPSNRGSTIFGSQPTPFFKKEECVSPQAYWSPHIVQELLPMLGGSLD